MTESEPLSGRRPFAQKGQIVQSERLNGGLPCGNSQTAPAGSDRSKASELAPPIHIEAPCCRDIHGNDPPDGGTRAWLVMISAFLCNGVIFGIINTYGVIHSLLTDRLAEQGDTEASSKAALVGSLTIGTTFLLSPVAGCLTDKIGLRMTTFAGGLLSAGGLLLSSFFTQNIAALYLMYGLMFGFGAALAYTPTLAILGHYFKRYLGKVSGFVTAGSSVFTVVLPPGLDYLLKTYGLEPTLQVMSLILTFVMVCSFVYKPLHPPPEPPQKKAGRSRLNMLLRSIINVTIWKRRKYVIWALCVPLALFGYFVPYVHMMKFVQTTFPGRSENLPVMCIGVTSGLGRLIFGVIADMPGVNRIYLQQLSLVCIGVVTLLLPLTSSYVLLIVFTLVMGLFDGCFISLLGPIAYEICGPSGATQAIGFLLGLSSIPLTVGPPIAGKIYDNTGSYTLPLILAGIPPIVGALVMMLIRYVRDDGAENMTRGVPVEGPGAAACDETGVREEEEGMSRGSGFWSDAVQSYEPLVKGHGSETEDSKVEGVALSNGKAHLADTGTDTESPSVFKRFFPVVGKVAAFNACASSSSLLTNPSVSSHTPLLRPFDISALVTIDGGPRNAPGSLPRDSDGAVGRQRRYTYSTY